MRSADIFETLAQQYGVHPTAVVTFALLNDFMVDSDTDLDQARSAFGHWLDSRKDRIDKLASNLHADSDEGDIAEAADGGVPLDTITSITGWAREDIDEI